MKARSCPSCRSVGTPRDGCQDLWHIEVRPVKPDWMPVVIHPQHFRICWAERFRVTPWPDVYEQPEPLRIWPVPRLVHARLVDCAECHYTGVQPQDYEALARYYPGATVVRDDPRGMAIQLPTMNDAIAYPTGSGEDEIYNAAERDAVLRDLSELLDVLGLGGHARPQTPHEVFQEALAEVRRRLA